MKPLFALCLLVGIALLLVDGELLAHPPAPGASRSMRKTYVRQMLVVGTCQLLCIVGAGVAATLIVRKARREYREESARNMKRLLDGGE